MCKFEGFGCEKLGKSQSIALLFLLCQMFFALVSLLLGLTYVGIIAWYIYGWRLAGSQDIERATTHQLVKVSIIVPARNEEEHIVKCLESLFAQDYRKDMYEIIVVDDNSEDNTAKLVNDYQTSIRNLKLIRLFEEKTVTGHKKRAIEAGIKAANGQLIACTDADCTHPTSWLTQMVNAYDGGKNKFIAAPVVYQTGSSLSSIFQTLDFMTLQGITAASVASNFHTMCNGANVAYERAAFFEVNGFEGIDNLPTGDDMLLMHKIYKRFPGAITYVLSKCTIVVTPPAFGWHAFFQQRIRWASKAAFYDDKRIFRVLLLVYLFNFWLLFLTIAGIIWQAALFSLIILLGVKTLAEFVFLWPVSGFFQKRKWLWWFPVLQPMHILYTLIAGWLGRFGSYTWKGRVIEKPTMLQK
jgi:cellulose synthase/poly-beta-1,6-N-acetylglucosamine synthase-like glycosyltransferase